MRNALKARLKRLEWAQQAGSSAWLSDLLDDMRRRTPVLAGTAAHAEAMADPRRASYGVIALAPDRPAPAHPIL